MTTKNYLDEYAGCHRVVDNCEDDGYGCKMCLEDRERMQEIIKELEASIRREVLQEVYEGIHMFDFYKRIDDDVKRLLNIEFKDSVKRFALSKGITLN